MLEIDRFIKYAKKPVIIAIIGPTGVGKSDLSISLAQKYNGEVINADSKQVYQGLEVTTGQITPAEMKNVKHYLLSSIDPKERYTVKQHCTDARECIKKIQKKNKIPFLVGGTSLFIDSLTQNFQFLEHEQDLGLRKKLEQKTNEELWSELKKCDPDYLEKTHPNNRVRVIRALEYFYKTGSKKSNATKTDSLFDTLLIMPKIKSREFLYEKINQRAEYIWHNGLLPEAKKLWQQNLEFDLPVLQSIGIPEAFAFLKQELSEVEAISLMQQKSRNYAKRQLTWWRNREGIINY